MFLNKKRIISNTKWGTAGALIFACLPVLYITIEQKTHGAFWAAWSDPYIWPMLKEMGWKSGLIGSGFSIARDMPEDWHPTESPIIAPVSSPKQLYKPTPIQQPPILDRSSIRRQKLKNTIEQEEGKVLSVYTDHKGNLTCGIGHLIDPGDYEYGKPEGFPISETRCNQLFSIDFNEAIEDAERLVKSWETLPVVVKHVLIEMVFQMGYVGVRKFKNTLRYINAEQWLQAADEMLDSQWYRIDTPDRAARLSAKVRAFAGNDYLL